MRNKKRFAALALATVLAVSQVTAMAPTSAVVAEETEESEDLTTDPTEESGAEGDADSEAETDSTEDTDSEGDADNGTEALTEGETGEASDSDTSDTETSSTLAGLTSVGSAADESESGETEETEEESDETEETTELQTAEETDTDTEETEDEDGSEPSEIYYWFNSEWLDGTSATLNGETIRLYISSIEWQVIWDDGSEDYTEITDFTIEPFTTGRYTSLEVEDAEDGGYILSFTGIREGGTDTVIIAGYDSDGDYVVEQEFGITVAEEYYTLSYDNGSIPNDEFQIGDTYSLANGDFTLTKYYSDEDGLSQSETVEIDGETYWLEMEEGSIDANNLEIQYAGDGSIDSLLRKTNWETNFWVQVWYANENGENEWLNDTCVYVDEYDISTEITKTYGTEEDEYYYYVFAGEDQTLTVSASDDSSFPENSAITWNVWADDEISAYVGWEYDNDGNITFYVDEEIPDEYREGYHIYFEYYLIYDGNEDNAMYLGGDSLEVLKAYYEYDEFSDQTLLNDGWWWNIGSTLGCNYRNMDHPYGDWTEVTITDVSLEQYDWEDNEVSGEDAVLELSGDADEGWTVTALNYGYAIVTFTYETVDGDENDYGTTSCIVSVSDDNYYLDWGYSTETGSMLVGAEITIDPLTLTHEYLVWLNADDNYYTSDDITDFVNSGYTLSVYDDEGEPAYDDSIISVSLDDGIVTISALEEGWTSIHLRVLDSEENEVASTNIDIEVTDYYYQLTGSVENVGLGESLDVENAGWVLTRNYTNEDGESVSEEVSEEEYSLYFSDIDTDFWGLNDDGWGELLTTTFVRNYTYDTNFKVYAEITDEEGNTDYAAEYWSSFDSIEYNGYISISYDGESTYYLFVDEPATLTLEPSGSNEYDYPDDCEVEWTVYYLDEESGWLLADETASLEQDGFTATLTANEADITYYITVSVFYQGNEITYQEYWTVYSTDESVTEAYVKLEKESFVVGEESNVLYASAYEYSTAYPSGKDLAEDGEYLSITDIQVVGVYTSEAGWEWGESDTSTVTVSGSEEDGWTITGAAVGMAWLDFILEAEDGTEYTSYCVVTISEETYELSMEEAYTLSIDESVTIPVTLTRTYTDESGTVQTSDATEKLTSDEAALYFGCDEDLDECLTVTVEDGEIIVNGAAAGNGVLYVYVVIQGEEGVYYYANTSAEVTVVKKDAAITADATSYTKTIGNAAFGLNATTDSDGTLSYSVSGSAVTVDSDGIVTIQSTGTATITISVPETSTYKAATLTVTVTVNAAETESETTATESETTATQSETTATESETTATENESETETLYIIEAATDDEYTIGKDTSAVVKCNGELSEFISVAVDGVTVDASNYTLTEGSTIITFTQDYMDTLSVGVHTVTLTYTGDRTVSALLTVKELTSDSETESETETTAAGSETGTESETTATESETDAAGSETDVNGNETDASGSVTDAAGSETDVDGTETDANDSETDESGTATESETTAAETTATAAETTATDSETDSSVATGDNSPVEIYVAVMLLAMSILMVGTLYRRMNKNVK